MADRETLPTNPDPHTEAPASDRVRLPDLPMPRVCYADHSYPAFSAKQMQAYARAAIALAEAGRAVPSPKISDLLSAITEMSADGYFFPKPAFVQHRQPDGVWVCQSTATGRIVEHSRDGKFIGILVYQRGQRKLPPIPDEEEPRDGD